MKKFLLFIICSWMLLPLSAENSQFVHGNDLYSKGKYTDAINVYKGILNTNLESADLYFNLANAYYKTDKLPEAILNYERALLLQPHDKDIIYNRDLAASHTTDKIESSRTFFLITWFKNFRNSSKSDTWAIISLICFIVAILSASLFLLSKRRLTKQSSFYAGIILLIISFVAFNFSAAQKHDLTHRDTAIVFAQSTAIKSSPSSQGTELFVLHEGTKVTILQKLGNWKRIQIGDGSEGWLPASDIVVI